MAGPAPALSAGHLGRSLTLRRQFLATAVLAFTNFMVVLDMTIANVSVPSIAGGLGITMDQSTWVVTSYAVAEAICVPLTGWLAARFGAIRLYFTCVTGFVLFSVVCGLSPTLGMLVAARIGQGLFGAPLMPICQTLMMLVVAPENRNRSMGLWAMTSMSAPAFGPMLGGVITDALSWHWIFLINLPIGIAVTAIASVLLKGVDTTRERRPIDAIGLALLVLWVGLLQVVLDTGRERDWFDDTRTVVLCLLAAVGFVVFVIWELTEEHPVVDLRIFANRGFALATAGQSIGFAAMFAGVVIAPQFLQSTMGYTALQSGMVTGAGGIASALVSAIAARAAARLDHRLVASLALTWVGGWFMVRAGWTTQHSQLEYALPVFMMGLGMPFYFIPLNQLAMLEVRASEYATASGMLSFTRISSQAIVASIVLTMWGSHQRLFHTEMAGVLHPDATVAALGQAGVGLEGARITINAVVDQQAVTLAMDQVSAVAAICMVLAGWSVWLMPRRSEAFAPGQR